MEETGFHRFAGNLDPRAREFVPRNHQLPFVSNNVFYPYTSTPPAYFHPFPPPGQPPLCDGSSLAGYPQPFSLSPAYLGMEHSLVPCVNSLPPRTMPSRALLLTMVPADVSESTVRRELEVFGDVRAVQMERVREGIVTVHFYNLRQAQEALTEIQEQHMQQQYRLRRHFEAVVAQNSLNLNFLPSPHPHPPPPMPPPAPGLIAGRAVWAQFTAPVASSLPDGNNQGTLVIFNLDPDVSTNSLKQTFEIFGAVKELRETPMKKHQRFVEFYDIRDAAKALAEMNGKEILGKQIVIEFSRPGGHSKKHSKFTGSFASTGLNFVNNYSARPSRIMPPPPPPSATPRQLPCQLSGCPPVRPYNSPAQHLSDKRSSYFKGNPKANVDKRSSIQNSRASLSVNGTGAEKSANAKPSNSKKNGKKSGNHVSSSTSTSKQQPQQTKGNRPWKGLRQSKEYDPRFLINEDAITESNCRDSRTTVMIKNIPNKYSQKLLLNMLDNHCIHCNEQVADGDNQPLSSYDFVYLPIDFVNKCNVGYGFVNMTSPEATLRLYKAFHRQSWEVFNSRKICEVTYARLQGIEALKEHFKNSKFPCEADEYMPVVFSPPRDGRRLTDPVPIIGGSAIISPKYRTCSSSSPAVSSKEEESENGEIEYEDFQELEEIDGVNGHINNAGGHGNDNDDVDEDEDLNGGGGRSNCSSNGGDSGEDHQYYDGDDVDDGSEHLTLSYEKKEEEA